MGVLYAKVAGSWQPILNSTGQFLPLTGGQLTGPLLITGGGEADLTSTTHHLQLGASTGDNLAFDANEIQSRNNGAASVLNLNPHGGNVWLGSDSVASNLHLRGPLPTGTPIDFWAAGQRVASIFPFGAAFPVDLVIQQIGGSTVTRNIALQPTTMLTIDTRGTPTAQFGASVTDQLRFLRTSGQAWSYISFYDETNTTRCALVGTFNGALALHSDGGQHIWIGSDTGYTMFGKGLANAFTEYGRFDGSGNFMLGMLQALAANPGMHYNAGSRTIVSTTDDPVNFSLICNKVSLGSGHNYVAFRNNNSTIGSITRNGTTAAVLYNTTSDYRLKEDRGQIEGARERIKLLTPRRIVWRDDETQTEMDGFFAHEVAEAVPEAVTGEKDAVATETNEDKGLVEGQIVPQQLDASRLIPLLVAAVKELSAEIETLKAEVSALKGAA